MIARSEPIWQTHDWQTALKGMIRSLDELCAYLDISLSDLPDALRAEKDFAVKVPLSYLRRIEKGNPRDPLLLQVLPQAEEMLEVVGFTEDPLEEKAFNKVPGLIHKYHGRVLLISNPSCAVHCRYCFRRHFPYSENTPGSQNFAPIFNYIQGDSSITEVILSGGDPLMSNDKQLGVLVSAIEKVPHVKTLRFHTRIPVVLPERITPAFLTLVQKTRLKVVMVVHVNHVNEIDASVVDAFKHLQQSGVRLLNQSVLLKGVNDTVNDQILLLEKLHEVDVQPYYLHVLDRTKGTAHFLVEDAEALILYESLRSRISGYLLPKLVREEPFDRAKKMLSSRESG